MYVVGIDPSSKAPAFAIINIDTGKIIDYGQRPLMPLHKWIHIINKMDGMVIEGQYLGTNTNSLIVLSKSVGMLEGIASICGVAYKEVKPSTWQSKILTRQGEYKAKRAQLKALSKIVASDIVKTKIVNHDIADAICIAWFSYKYKLFDKRQKRSNNKYINKRKEG